MVWEVQDGSAEMTEGNALKGLSQHVSQHFISWAVFDKEVANVNVVHPVTARALAILFQ